MSYTFSETNKTLDFATPLVTKAQVLLICGDEIDDMSDDEAESFINTAHILLCSVLDGYGLPSLLLIEIEKYLAGHFGTLAFPSIHREGLAGLSSSIVAKVGLGLQNTRYGQSAISLDPTGKLKEISDGKLIPNVRMSSIGYQKTYD